MQRIGIICAIMLAFGVARAQPLHEVTANCTEVKSCVTLIDSFVEVVEVPTRRGDLSKTTAQLKSRFGEEMRVALLENVQSGSESSAKISLLLLENWGDWKGHHLNRLSKLFRENESVGILIGEVGTDEAFEILFRDYLTRETHPNLYDFRNFSDEKVIDRSVEWIQNTVLNAESIWRSPQSWRLRSIISTRLDVISNTYLAKWINTVRSPDSIDRVAAIRAIGMYGEFVSGKGRASFISFEKRKHDKAAAIDALRPLLSEKGNIADEAKSALIQLADENFAVESLNECMSDETGVEGIDWEKSDWAADIESLKKQQCIWSMRAFGAGAARASDQIISFLNSDENSSTRMAALEFMIDQRVTDAIPLIEESLYSANWNEILTAVMALVALDSQTSKSKIQRVAETHWWPEVRRLARQGVEFLDGDRIEWSPSPRSRVSDPVLVYGEGFQFFTGVGSTTIETECSWEGQSFSFSQRADDISFEELSVRNGSLKFFYKGRWGSVLLFESDSGERSEIQFGPLELMISDHGSVIALFSDDDLSIGYATRVDEVDGQWEANVIGYYPSAIDAFVRLKDGHYSALSDGWAVVFDNQRILGLAECDGAAH